MPFLKIVFCNIAPLGDQKKRSHMKVKSKISYLGERNSILPVQMAEQLAVEVDVKNVTDTQTHTHTHGQGLIFALGLYNYTRSSGPYGPLLLAPAEGFRGPFRPLPAITSN